MKRFIRNVGECAKLYRDDKTGIATIYDGTTGNGHSCHPNIDKTGSITGMKHLGYWAKKDRAVRSGGFIYNIDRFVVTDDYDKICADECRCSACLVRREIKDNSNQR